LSQLKKFDDIDIKQLKFNNNFNSPLSKKELNQNNNNSNYNIQSPSNNMSSNKSDSESIS
jgi:hypothetical protein